MVLQASRDKLCINQKIRKKKNILLQKHSLIVDVEIEEEGDSYDSIIEIWPDYPTEEDYLWNEDEY